jgi:hypothetical protein
MVDAVDVRFLALLADLFSATTFVRILKLVLIVKQFVVIH